MTTYNASEIDRLVREGTEDNETLPTGPWEVWTSNSFRRITGPDGRDGGVLSGVIQRSDGHPDLSMSERPLEAIARTRNNLPAMVAQLSAAKAEVEKWRNCVVCIECGRTAHDDDGCCVTCGRDCAGFENGKWDGCGVADHFDAIERDRDRLSARVRAGVDGGGQGGAGVCP